MLSQLADSSSDPPRSCWAQADLRRPFRSPECAPAQLRLTGTDLTARARVPASTVAAILHCLCCPCTTQSGSGSPGYSRAVRRAVRVSQKKRQTTLRYARWSRLFRAAQDENRLQSPSTCRTSSASLLDSLRRFVAPSHVARLRRVQSQPVFHL